MGALVLGCDLGFQVFSNDCGIVGMHWDNLRVILGLYWDNEKENGSYYKGLECGCREDGRQEVGEWSVESRTASFDLLHWP